MLHASAAAAALWGTAAGTPASAAAESPATISKPAAAAHSTALSAAADFDLFRGKGGFTLRRPSNAGWVTAFVRHRFRASGIGRPCAATSASSGH